jgi:hypothetical protein
MRLTTVKPPTPESNIPIGCDDFNQYTSYRHKINGERILPQVYANGDQTIIINVTLLPPDIISIKKLAAV